MSIQKLIAVFALVITASGANAASLRYEIIDYGAQVNGFSVSGTVEASRLGNFVKGDGDDPFTDWNITEIVGLPGEPTENYSFTPGNSTWDLIEGGPKFATLIITEDFIYLPEIFFGEPNNQDNAVSLINSGADQGLLWENLAGPLPETHFLVSGNSTFDLDKRNGAYTSSGNDFIIATRIPPIPLPASGLLLIGAVAALGAHRARRKSA